MNTIEKIAFEIIAKSKIGQARLEWVLSKIPARFRKNLKIKWIDAENWEEAYHIPGNDVLRISNKLLNYYFILSRFSYEWEQKNEDIVKEVKKKTSKIGVIYDSNNQYDLGKNGEEYGSEYLLNLLAHEIGHIVFEKHQEIKDKAKKIKLNTPTTRRYEEYVGERKQQIEDEGRMVPIVLENKVQNEKFAEMFRLYVTEGKYQPFFKDVKI